LPFSKSHSPNLHPTTMTASAPLRIACRISAVSTRPVHRTRIRRTQSEYCFLADPARSAAPYPHFQQANRMILRPSGAWLTSPATSASVIVISKSFFFRIMRLVLYVPHMLLHVLGGILGFTTPFHWTGDGQLAPGQRPGGQLLFDPPTGACGNSGARARGRGSW